ncbi:hypothetical protein PCASD_20548, partial [Puccinia coronata f. sp. avenae]
MSHNGATEHSGRPRAVEEITEEINQTHTKLLQLQTELNTALNAQKVYPEKENALSLNDYIRYGRQMIVSQ